LLSVSPVVYNEDVFGVSGTMTITGDNFNPSPVDIQIWFGDFYAVVSSAFTVNPDRTEIEITLSVLPTVSDMGFVFDTVPCVSGGQTGIQFVSTAVDLRVSNGPEDCSAVLPGAFVINPTNTLCQLPPEE
jgi:hypothetical protein